MKKVTSRFNRASLLEAIERQSKSKNVLFRQTALYEKDGEGRYPVVIKGTEASNDYLHILNGLPVVIQDNIGMTKVVDGMIGIIASQQAQINELSIRIEEITRASIALKAQENVHDILMKLTSQGSDVMKPEVTIRLSASSSYKTSEETDRQSHTSSVNTRSASAEVAGHIQAILSDLLSLRVGLDFDASKAAKQIEQLHSQSSLSHERNYQGDVVIKFESITGHPLVQAQAEAIKRGLITAGGDMTKNTENQQ